MWWSQCTVQWYSCHHTSLRVKECVCVREEWENQVLCIKTSVCRWLAAKGKKNKKKKNHYKISVPVGKSKRKGVTSWRHCSLRGCGCVSEKRKQRRIFGVCQCHLPNYTTLHFLGMIFFFFTLSFICVVKSFFLSLVLLFILVMC